jgi:hypothetical protein
MRKSPLSVMCLTLRSMAIFAYAIMFSQSLTAGKRMWGAQSAQPQLAKFEGHPYILQMQYVQLK